MTEGAGAAPQDTGPLPVFPGATAVTMLEVYDWPTADGLRGGSAHVHLASAEGYVILSGTGRLQTLGPGGYAESELKQGDCLWFTPGVIHRLVNDGGLRLLVVMQNAGLPEAGDAVLTFPPEVLADRGAYARAAALSPGDPGERARQRRDLALEGYLALRDRVASEGQGALGDFLSAAIGLVGVRVPGWRERWRAGALGAASATGGQLDGIEAGDPGHLASAGLWRIGSPDGPRSWGMCGLLTRYDPAAAARVI